MVITCGFEEADPKTWFSHSAHSPSRAALRREIYKLKPGDSVASGVTKRDFDTLAPGFELATSVLNFSFGYLQDLVRESQWPNRVCLLQSGQIEFPAHKKFVFFPVQCEHGDWSLLVLCTHQNRAYYYNGYRQCQHGFGVAQEIMDAAANALKCPLLLLELHTPQQYLRQDSGVLVCEISALLVRRLVHAKPYHRISLGLMGAKFIAQAGRAVLEILLAEQWDNERDHLERAERAERARVEVARVRPKRIQQRASSIRRTPWPGAA